MHADSYRWQDHVLSPHRRGIDLAVTGLFALALAVGAVMDLAGGHEPTASADRLTLQTAQYRAPHSQSQPSVPLDCGA